MMTAQPAPDWIRLLEESRREFNEAAAGLPEAQAAQSPEPGCWSVLECVEHMATAEGRSLRRLADTPHPETPVSAREERLEAALADRSRPSPAPEAVRPASRYATLAQAMGAFNLARQNTIRLAQERAAELHLMAMQHPLLGVLNGHDTLAAMIGHSRRHAAQIREIRKKLAEAQPE